MQPACPQRMVRLSCGHPWPYLGMATPGLSSCACRVHGAPLAGLLSAWPPVAAECWPTLAGLLSAWPEKKDHACSQHVHKEWSDFLVATPGWPPLAFLPECMANSSWLAECTPGLQSAWPPPLGVQLSASPGVEIHLGERTAV